MSRLKIAVAATCAVAILAIGVSANAAFKDGHELLEAGDAYMDSTAKRFTEHSVRLGIRFSNYVSAFYDGHMYASLWHGKQTCVPPKVVLSERYTEGCYGPSIGSCPMGLSMD